MTYNMTAFEAANNTLQQFSAVNELSGNLLVTLALLSLFVVLVIRMIRSNPPAESFTAAGAVCAISALGFFAADLAPLLWFLGFTIVTAISGTAMYLNNKT